VRWRFRLPPEVMLRGDIVVRLCECEGEALRQAGLELHGAHGCGAGDLRRFDSVPAPFLFGGVLNVAWGYAYAI
jgi:hypothetical protein